MPEPEKISTQVNKEDIRRWEDAERKIGNAADKIWEYEKSFPK